MLDPSADGEHLAQRIERELGVDVVAHSQRPEPMSMAAQRFTAALRAGTLEHPADPRLTEHVLAAVPKAAGERWRFTRHRRPIDALIAAAMAVSVEVDAAEHGDSVYETRGVLVLELDDHQTTTMEERDEF